jgi:hypothetical protein
MSTIIGVFPAEQAEGRERADASRPRIGVWASRGGVELSPEKGSITLTPIEARAMAHALIAASEEVERMRLSKT